MTLRRARERFRAWRHRRPFWAGMLTILSGVQVFASTQLTVGSLQVRIGIEGLQSIVIPVVLVLAGLLIWFMPAHRVFYGVITLVVALYSMVGVNLGGFLIGMILGVVGGALAVAWMPRETDLDEPRSQVGDGLDDDTLGVDDLLGGAEPEPEPQPDAHAEPDVEPGADPEAEPDVQPGRRARRRTAFAAGAGSAGIALVALAVPSIAGPSAVALPALIQWPTPSDEPSPSPTRTGPIVPTGIPVPTTQPSPTSSPTGDPEEPDPEDPDPDEPDPDEPDQPDPDEPEEPGDPTTPPTPDPDQPVIEVPEGETPAEPRAIVTPENLAGENPGHLKGSQLVMNGLSYDGVVEVPTATGSIPSLQFSMDKSVVSDFSLLVPGSDGHDLLTLADELTVEGDVKFYTNRFSGQLLGIPLTFTPDFPPPLVLSDMTFTNPDINLVYIASDSLTAANNRQHFTED